MKNLHKKTWVHATTAAHQALNFATAKNACCPLPLFLPPSLFVCRDTRTECIHCFTFNTEQNRTCRPKGHNQITSTRRVRKIQRRESFQCKHSKSLSQPVHLSFGSRAEGTGEQSPSIGVDDPPDLRDRNVLQRGDPVARNGDVFRLVLGALHRSLRRNRNQPQSRSPARRDQRRDK